jgi:DNA repair exonuclease SbcCD ATPase subunit
VPKDLLGKIESKNRILNELEIDIESRKLKVKIYNQKIADIEKGISQRQSEISNLEELEEELEQRKSQISEKYKNLASMETQELDLRASLDAQENSLSQISQFNAHSNQGSSSKFQNYNYTTLEPVSEKNESDHTFNNGNQRDSILGNSELTETVLQINNKLDELMKGHIDIRNNSGHKMSLSSLGVHSHLNSIPTSTYGTAYKESYFGENGNGSGREVEFSLTERNNKDDENMTQRTARL